MKIRGITVYNYRSIGSQAVLLDETHDVSIMVGTNNAGKSTVIRFLLELAAASKRADRFRFDPLLDRHRGGDAPPYVEIHTRLHDLVGEGSRHCKDRTVIIPYPLTSSPTISEEWPSNGLLTFDEYDYVYRYAFQKRFAERVYPRDASIHMKSRMDTLIRKAVADWLTRCMFVPEHRMLTLEHPRQWDGIEVANGKQTVKRLGDAQHPPPGKDGDRENFDAIERLIQRLLGDSTLRLEVTSGNADIVVQMADQRLPLASFGGGIHQLAIVCTAIQCTDASLVLFEEPETHLHPHLQRRFIEFLTGLDKQVLMTTHSPVMLDATDRARIYRVEFANGATKVEAVVDTTQLSGVVDGLGARASDLVQSNAIVWVEGPSDRIFFGECIRRLAPEIVEGIHYSIAMFGGALLKHYAASLKALGDDSETDELIDLLRINRHAFVIMDRDADPSSSDLGRLGSIKERVSMELGADHVLVTAGVTVENYYPYDLVKAFVESRIDKATSFSMSDASDVIADVESAIGVKTLSKTKLARIVADGLTDVHVESEQIATDVGRIVDFLRRVNGLPG